MRSRRLSAQPPKSPQRFSDPRYRAVHLLVELDRGRRTLDALVEGMEAAGGLRDGRDRDLLNAILFGVLRWRGRLDYIIAHFSKTPLPKIDLPILNILRVGLFQLIFLTRIPASAAVHTSVEMAKSEGAPWVGAFVNAILRRAAAKNASVRFPDPQKDPVRSLAAIWAFPEWLMERWIGRYGAELTARLCESINVIPPLTVRTNTLATSREDLIMELATESDAVEPTVETPDGIRLSGLRMRVSALSSFQRGWFQVQDEAAQLVSLLLAPRPGETVLDACAGRGGKTGHIAQLMGNQGTLVALDRSGARLAELTREMRRLGVSIVSCREASIADGLAAEAPGRFDRVLLDAPCSGLGTLRRNPDIKWAAGRKDLSRYQRTQSTLFERAAEHVAPGGVLVYAVCSPEPEETVDVVRTFLAKYPQFRIDRDAPDLPGIVRPLLDSGGFLQTYPNLRYMDGFFATRLRLKD
jgi:16S rRNA (cytosine967-C5)-methyltransferase